MDHKAFFKQIDILAGTILFSGEEEYVKQEALKALLRAHLPEGLETLNEAVFEGCPDIGTLESACETLPFMSEKRLVIIRDCPLVTAEGKADAALADEYAGYLEKIPGHAVLVFYARGAADKRKKVAQKITAMGGSIEFPALGEGEILRWSRKYCAGIGKEIAQDAVSALIALSGPLLQDVKDGLDKAAAYCGDAPAITKRDIEAVVSPSAEYRGYQMASALLDGSGGKALEMLGQLSLDGEKALSLLGSVTRALEQHFSVKLMLEGKKSIEAVSALLKIPAGAVRAVGARARRLDTAFLKGSIELCNEANYRMKTTSMNEDAALSQLYIIFFHIINGLKEKADTHSFDRKRRTI